MLIVATIFTALAALSVALRLWTRFWLVRAPGIDDLMIFCALVVDLAFYALVLLERRYGLGVPRAKLAPDVIRSQLQYLWLSMPFYNLALIFAKLSALCLFIRLFRSRPFLLATYFLMGFLVIAALWMTLSGFIFCVPVHDFWNLSPKGRDEHCLPVGPVWYTNSGIHLGSDLAILVMPMPLIWKLQLPPPQKLGLLIVFGLGIFVIATSSARLYELSIMVESGDFTKTNYGAALWSSLQVNISIICACLPPLHSLISRIFSFCFLPQPLRSSPATKVHSNTAQLTELRKASTYDLSGANHAPKGGVWYNEFFTPGPTGYSASITNLNANVNEPDNEDGIRVVREFRTRSDSVGHTSIIQSGSPRARDRDLEMGSASSNSAGSVNRDSDPSIDWDLGEFEFPDYKTRMNALI